MTKRLRSLRSILINEIDFQNKIILEEEQICSLEFLNLPKGTIVYVIPNMQEKKISKIILSSMSRKSHFISCPVYQVTNSEGMLTKVGEVITRNRSSYFENLASCLENILNNSQKKNFIPNQQETICKWPNLIFYSSLTIKRLTEIIWGSISSRLFNLSWHVMILEGNTSLDVKNGIYIPNPENHYFADPFLFTRGNQTYIFLEDYSIANSKGSIRLFELKFDAVVDLGTVLAEDHHISFPYIFEYNQKTFMVPEAVESGRLTIYESLNFPFNWVPVSILPDNVFGADPMIFEFNGRWWLFLNPNEYEKTDFSSALSIFWSKDPINGPWNAHPQNPVIGPSKVARNAGLQFSGDKLFRFSQIQDTKNYGVGLMVNEVLQLDEFSYSETEITAYKGRNSPAKKGFHHMHVSNDKIVIDVKKQVRRKLKH